MEVLLNATERLSKKEASKLNKILRSRHGNITACANKTGLNTNTLKRAKDGLEIKKINADTIREVLLAEEVAVA